MDSTKAESGNETAKQPGSMRWFKGLIIFVIVFLGVAGTMFYLGRHAWNFYQLYQGNQDRSLMAIDSANLHGDTLDVTFIRSEPDKPDGAFVLAGHKPAYTTMSNPKLQNTVNDETVTFDGVEYEILFEATDREQFPERSAMFAFHIDWIDREKGHIALGPINQRAINHIVSNRAFLLLTKDDGEFYTSSITSE